MVNRKLSPSALYFELNSAYVRILEHTGIYFKDLEWGHEIYKKIINQSIDMENYYMDIYIEAEGELNDTKI